MMDRARVRQVDRISERIIRMMQLLIVPGRRRGTPQEQTSERIPGADRLIQGLRGYSSGTTS